MNADLFDYSPPAAPFKDIRNQRESVAEEKARLSLELNKLLKTPPRSLNGASVNRVREFFAEHARALKTLRSKDSSRNELQAAINAMRRFD